MKLVEFLASHGLERHVRALIRSNLLTFEELSESHETVIESLEISASDLRALKKALGRKTDEPVSITRLAHNNPVEHLKPFVSAEINQHKTTSKTMNLKLLYLISCGLVLIGSFLFLALFMNQELLYDSEKIFSNSKKQEASIHLVSEVGKHGAVPMANEKAPMFRDFIGRYQEALRKQDPSEIVAYFAPDGLIEYYQKSFPRQEMLNLLEAERLNDPILVRSVEYEGTIEPPRGETRDMTWARLALKYETKKGMYEKKIRVGVVRISSSGLAILSESNEGTPVETDSSVTTVLGKDLRGAPFSPVAWTDPGRLTLGELHQLELVFYGLKPTQQWGLPNIPKMQIQGQPKISQNFHQGRTDMSFQFTVRLSDSGEVRIPSFRVITDKGSVEVPGLTLNPIPRKEESEFVSGQGNGRGLLVKKRTNGIKEEVAEMKDFYFPADVFPENKIGMRVVGKFIVLRFSNGGHYLSADQSRGEKDAVRRFVPENCDLPLGGRYTFTAEEPLIISSVSMFGQYGVLVPVGIRPDRY
ncbi:hypothetical protein EBX31_01000 [bacterium]|nr:hypothetical protein [bacterium]